jgi:hypothetical protein
MLSIPTVSTTAATVRMTMTTEITKTISNTIRKVITVITIDLFASAGGLPPRHGEGGCLPPASQPSYGYTTDFKTWTDGLCLSVAEDDSNKLKSIQRGYYPSDLIIRGLPCQGLLSQ